MIKHANLVAFCLVCSINLAYSQHNQTVKGSVVDQNSGFPLAGAAVVWVGSDPIVGVVTDIDGKFRLEKIPVGRQSFQVSYLGYETAVIRNIYVISGKETELIVKLEERIIEGEEIIIKAFGKKNKPINEMAVISARSFSIEETERYAGGIGDPARMASNFAGVSTLGTQINDIVIRGNSPIGLQWKMEGLTIPNPNHFGTMGGSGGTISMLNNNVLRNSDFYTGAFPAEYGNALAGVFDLNMRNGNNDKREYLAQMSFNGPEIGIEGPVIKNKQSSYMANYRSFSLAIFNKLGLQIGTPAIPFYQDLNYKITIPTKKAGQFSLFGIYGKNTINDENVTDSVYDSFNNHAEMFFSGIKNTAVIGENSSLTTTIGYSACDNKSGNLITKNNEKLHDGEYINNEKSIQVNTEYKTRINPRNNIKTGINYKKYFFSYYEKFFLPNSNLYKSNLDIEGQMFTLQSFAQWKLKLSNQLTWVSGLHYYYSEKGNDHSVEPRFGLEWSLNDKQSINLGIGKHSQLQPLFVYNHKILVDTVNQIYTEPNKNLKLSKSHHYVLGYNYFFTENLRLKIEGYYQYLYDIPVEQDSSYLSLINYGSTFSVYEYKGLINKGTGRNIGTEITFEKFLSDNYYFLITLSLFDSKYRGSDGILRNTKYNSNIITNILGGYEWPLKNQNTFAIDIKSVFVGGERKIPIDLEASKFAKKTVYDISDPYHERHKHYFRFDFRISYKLNRPKASHVFGIDLMNATNRQNHFLEMYNNITGTIGEASQLGLMPSALWRMNF